MKKVTRETETRRRFLRQLAGSAAGLAAAPALLAACGGPQKQAGADTKGAPIKGVPPDVVVPAAYAGRLAPATLQLAIPSGPEADAHTRLAPEFTKYTRGRVHVEVNEYSTEGFESKYATLMESKSAEWDIIRNDVLADFQTSVPRGWFSPLDEFMADPNLFNAEAFKLHDYLPGIIDLFTYQGKLYGFIQEASSLMLFYRRDLLQKYAGVARPPEHGWSFDEITQISRRMRDRMRADGLPTYPFFFEADPTQANCTLYQLVTSTGTPLLSARNEPQFSAAAVRDVVNWSVSLQREGLTPPGLGGDAYSQGTTLLQNQTAAMGIQWNAAAIDVLNKAESPAVYDKIGFGIMPYSPAGGPQGKRIAPSVWGLGVSAFSNYPEQAFAYIAWFSSPEVARDYVTHGGGSSGRSSLLSDPAIVARNPQYKTLLKSFPFYARFPDNPAMAYIFNDLMSSAGNAIWSGASSPEAALAGLDQDVAAYLESAGEHVG